MGAPVSKIEAAEEKTAEALLSAFKHLAAAERRKHATVFNYWMSIRRDAELPPIRDLDPLEITDAAPSGVLVELVNGGEDAEILHVGEKLRDGVASKRLSEVPGPSPLSCVAGKLGIVAISRDVLAFEEMFEAPGGTTRCCVTLFPFSMSGDTADFVYGLVSVETGVTTDEETTEPEPVAEKIEAAVTVTDDAEPVAETIVEEAEVVDESEPEVAEEPEPVMDETPPEIAAQPESLPDEFDLPQFLTEPQPAAEPGAKPGFSKIFDRLAGAKGFFGTTAAADQEPQPVAEEFETPPVVEEAEQIPDEPESPVAERDAVVEEPAPVAEEPVVEEPTEEPEPITEEPVAEPVAAVDEETEEPAPPAVADVEKPRPMEGTLQSKLADVRSMADEARAAKLRAETALVQGLSAAYDFALDAEDAPEEYLKLVEAQGLKIQLRSPMKPVVKLAFDGYCDDHTINDLESVLAWALKMDLPRGTLAQRIEDEGGIGAVLNGHKRRTTDN